MKLFVTTFKNFTLMGIGSGQQFQRLYTKSVYDSFIDVNSNILRSDFLSNFDGWKFYWRFRGKNWWKWVNWISNKQIIILGKMNILGSTNPSSRLLYESSNEKNRTME